MKRKWLIRIGAVLLGLFAALQFVPAERTNPAVVSDLDASADVKEVLRRACYDCHSNETDWPWYSYVAPVSWWVIDHVEHGRRDLNFSDWPNFDFEAQDIAFVDIREQVANGEMPLPSYLILHRSAKLSDEDRRLIMEWAADVGFRPDGF